MLKRENRLNIVFSSLKEGKHTFGFEITPEFFEGFDCSIIQKANMQVGIEMEKKSNMLVFDFDLKGEIIADCARCSEEMIVSVEGNEHLIVKFGDPEQVELNDEIVWLDKNAFEIGLSQQVYEYIHLLLPVRNVHVSKKECNPEVIKKLNELSVKEVAVETDPRWEELKKIKKD